MYILITYLYYFIILYIVLQEILFGINLYLKRFKMLLVVI